LGATMAILSRHVVFVLVWTSVFVNPNHNLVRDAPAIFLLFSSPLRLQQQSVNINEIEA